MSISKHARCSQIIKEVSNGKFVKNNRFHNFGSVAEDSIMAQQEEADRRLAQIQAQRRAKELKMTITEENELTEKIAKSIGQIS